MYRGWTQTDYQNKHYNINPKDEGTLDDRGRDEGTNFILRIKEQETRLTLQEHDDNVLYAFVCFWHVPHPIVWRQLQESMECIYTHIYIYIYMYVCCTVHFVV